MDKNLKDFHSCQMRSLGKMGDKLAAIETIWQKRNRLRRIFKRRWNYLMNSLSKSKCPQNTPRNTLSVQSETNGFQPGDLVRVQSEEEIRATLNHWNQLKGCSFMEEMWQYCGTTQRVLKRVEKFLDERDYLIKRCNGIVLLDGLFCEGTRDFGPCDRTCFFFWREEWLEKIK